jgi:hypothetical protein
MGRPKGSKNKIGLIAEHIAANYHMHPFEVLMKILNNDWEGLGYEAEIYHKETPSGEVKIGYVLTPQMRLDAAKEATKYLFSQKKAVEISTPEGEGFRIEVVDYVSKK